MMIADQFAEKELRKEPDDDEDDAARRDLVRHRLVPLEEVGVDRVAGGSCTIMKVIILSEK